MNSLEIINRWYTIHCDGLWEHAYGIKLETIDNPGYTLSINLENSCLSGKRFEKNFDNSDLDWYSIDTQKDHYVAVCSVNNLEECIRIFKEEFLRNNLDENYIYYSYFETQTKEFIKVNTVMTPDLILKVAETQEVELPIAIGSLVEDYLTLNNNEVIRGVRLLGKGN